MLSLREKLIETLIQVEKDARQMEEEGYREARNLRKEYRSKMELEKKERLEQIQEEGKRIVHEAIKEAKEYQKQVELDLKREIETMETKFSQVRQDVLDKYFNKIVQTKGE